MVNNEMFIVDGARQVMKAVYLVEETIILNFHCLVDLSENGKYYENISRQKTRKEAPGAVDCQYWQFSSNSCSQSDPIYDAL